MLEKLKAFKYWKYIIFIFAFFHLLLTFYYCGPSRYTKTARTEITSYMYPVFEQKWRLFAPAPRYYGDFYISEGLNSENWKPVLNDWRKKEGDYLIGLEWRKNIAQHSLMAFCLQAIKGLGLKTGKQNIKKSNDFFETPPGKLLFHIISSEIKKNSLIKEVRIDIINSLEKEKVYSYYFITGD
jgi:hypothetical protein